MAQFPNSDQADGIWTLKKVRRAILGDNWPPLLPPDEFFANTVLLLNAENASNGGQNNTFLDSSSNAHTITRNGNVTQGSFSPFSVDDGKWGNYVSANGSKIGSSSTNVGDFGTADFSVEWWMYQTTANSGASVIASVYAGNNSEAIWGITVSSGATNNIVWNNSGTTTIHSTSADVFNNNEWTHVAICREGTTNRLFVNGSLVSSQNDTTNYVNGANGIGIFDDNSNTNVNAFLGYISNLRIVKGTAVYTSAFTPSTTPLTDIAGTSLLTCQSNRFVDNSSNAHSITVNGTTKVVPFSPFPQTTAYDASTNGGSGYFDGSGDYLTVPATTDFAMGTGDFTVDGWVYWNGLQTKGLFHIGTSHLPSATKGIAIGANNTSLWRIYTGQGDTNSTTKIIPYQWQHFAYVRDSATVKLYVDGTEVISVSDTRDHNYQYLAIGGYFNTSYLLDGYLSNLRIVKGTALYTSSFTPPASLTTEVSGTSFIGNFTNASVFDSTGKNVLETVGNAQVDTTTVKYGTGAMEFDETGDYLTVPSNESLVFGTGDFTIEGWAYFNVTPTGNAQGLFHIGDTGYLPSNGNGPALQVNASNVWNAYIGGGNYSAATGVTTGQWYHFAYVRNSGTTTIYIDGTSVISQADTTNYTESYLAIGGIYSTTYLLNGFIDDLRITKGIARYTANFTPPGKQLPVIG